MKYFIMWYDSYLIFFSAIGRAWIRLIQGSLHFYSCNIWGMNTGGDQNTNINQPAVTVTQFILIYWGTAHWKTSLSVVQKGSTAKVPTIIPEKLLFLVSHLVQVTPVFQAVLPQTQKPLGKWRVYDKLYWRFTFAELYCCIISVRVFEK